MTGLRYHAPTKCFVIDPKAMEMLALEIRYAIKTAREMGGRPLEPHKVDGPMSDADHLEKCLIDMADRMGIDLGCTWPGQLDLREKP